MPSLTRPETVDLTLDARGLLCPLPVVKATKAYLGMAAGQVLEILATDKGARVDIPAWAKARSAELLFSDEDGAVLRFYVRK